MPSRRRTNPFAPASTTPARLSTASSSGVRWSDASARWTTRRTNTRRSRSPTAWSASAAVSRATVRMVPSTGSSSAPSRRSKPVRMPRARSQAPALSRLPMPSWRPSRNWESIMPELPRAPRTLAWAIAAVTSGRGASPRPRTACATARNVRHRLVPVSPSGTGKTLRRFSSSRPAATQSAAASRERRRRGPSTYAMPTPTGGSVLLLDDGDGDLGADLRMDFDAHPEFAQRADWLGEVDFPLIDVDPLLLEFTLDVARGHRPVQAVLLADLDGEGEMNTVELACFALGGLALDGALLGAPVRL